MRFRLGAASGVAAASLFCVAVMAACSFGVDLENVFGDATDGGASSDGPAEAAIIPPTEAGIPSIEVVQLSMGESFGCGRRIDGTVMCWGESRDSGELGDGLKLSSSIPVLVKDVGDAVDLAAGQRHACVVRKSGIVSCWGYNQYRQLGEGSATDSPIPKDVVALTDATQVAAGGAFSCALKKDATVQCWGDNTSGQLGDGTVTPRSQPAPVTGLADVTQLVTGDSTACALVKTGEVYCWGRNANGQAGAPPPTDVKTALKVAGVTDVATLSASASANHFCAVTKASDLRCWGSGGNGGLGDAKSSSSAAPVVVLSINDAISVTTGGGHSCAVRKGGAVACWGLNNWRQVGLGDSTPTSSVSTPLPVDGLTGAKQAVAGGGHTCALLADGKQVSCWGRNVAGTLGRGSRILSDVPVKIVAATSITSFALGGAHGCAVDSKGGLACWGDNGLRQMSLTTFLATGTPTPVPGLSGVTRAAGGDVHTCAVIGGGQIKCWGGDSYGSLGDGVAPTYIRPDPVVFAAGPATDVSAGTYFTCALLSSSDVACTGYNDNLRLGRPGGNLLSPALVPTDAGPDANPEAGLPPFGVIKLAASSGHTCVIRTAGAVSCWGGNGSGECGVGQGAATLPVDVPLGMGAKDVASGNRHSCAVLNDGSVRCWGANNRGQTTGPTPTGPSLRTPDLQGKTAKAIAAGDDHSCALLTDGTVLCWGKGTSGSLGNGVRADSPSPVVVKGLATVKNLAGRGDRTCASLEDGTGFCWGNNRTGELGDGTIIATGTAAPVVGY